MPLPRRFALLLAPAVVLPLTIVSISLGAPPTDEKIDALISKIEHAGSDAKEMAAKRTARRDAAKEALAETELSEATFAQLKKIYDKGVAAASPELLKAMDARLEQLGELKTLDGARALDLRFATLGPAAPSAEGRKARENALGELAEKTLTHPAADELFKSGGGETVFRAVGGLSPETIKERKLVDLLTPRITAELSPAAASSLRGLVPTLVEMKDELGAEKFNAVRTRIAAAAESAAAKAKKVREERMAKKAPEPAGPDAEKEAERAAQAEEAQLKRLGDLGALASGPWARGELLGHEAPPIKFIWSNSEKPIQSFADLKGKVVLVDFWATWCGPCVGAFPKMREMQSRYAGYPVVILGVTSDQGARAVSRMPDSSGKIVAKTVNCAGDPAREHAMMTDFTKSMEMTWPVVFSEQSCFNPDFGVSGIPHLAIIDSAGVVRYNALRPYKEGRPSAKEEADHIDALLKEAKLPYPENPYVEAAPEPKKDAAKDEPKKG